MTLAITGTLVTILITIHQVQIRNRTQSVGTEDTVVLTPEMEIIGITDTRFQQVFGM